MLLCPSVPLSLSVVVDFYPLADPRSLYPHLREISSLASWTVSSHKPGCGVSALRHPSTTQFWQSDGPQPHTLTLHFAKRVTIAHMRLYVNHEQDESYTPTRLQIWAGTGYHDLLCVTEMNLDAPKGWLSVDLSNAGGPSEFRVSKDGKHDLTSEFGEDLGNSEEDDAIAEQATADDATLPSELILRRHRRRRLRIGRGPTLRCFLVQVRILENNLNGKDTHLRAFQVFSKDHEVTTSNGRMLITKKVKPHDYSEESAANARKINTQKPFLEKLLSGFEEAKWNALPDLR